MLLIQLQSLKIVLLLSKTVHCNDKKNTCKGSFCSSDYEYGTTNDSSLGKLRNCRKANVLCRNAQTHRQQHKKLAITLFIVSFIISASMAAFNRMSYIIIHTMSGADLLKKSLHYTVRCLQPANSFVNPIFYYARMSEFNRQLKKIILR